MSSESVERRLTAILAADVAGYSRLMGADEEGTLAQLKAFRKTLVDPTIDKHRGRIVKTTGDGMLVEFASAVDAARCAVELQRGMADENTEIAEAKRIEFRIGIHLGDVIIDDDDIFGDGVNIAARLESIAVPGGISISRAVYDQVRDRINVCFNDEGEVALKNIARPVQVFAISGVKESKTTVSPESKPALVLPDKPSIAILPFTNMSGDPEQDYFADGMVEEIITALSRFKSLFVIARNSSFTYKGKAVDIKQVGRELGVRYVLEGSVRRGSGRVRITGQLIDAKNADHLWADKFEGTLDDIFDLQDRIAAKVVGAIAPKLQLLEFERIKRKPTDNPTAYDYYLRGLSKIYQFKKEATGEAAPLFKKAIEVDPDFAAPYAGAAWRYVQRQAFGWGVLDSQERAEVVALARRAVELDNDDATILAQTAYALAVLAKELEVAAALIERAVKANPNLALAWTYRGWINVLLGHPEHAVDDFKRALRLSPLDPTGFLNLSGLAYASVFSDQYAEAVRWAAEAVIAKHDFLPAHRIAMVGHALSGDIEAATVSWQVVRQLDPTQRISQARDRFPLRREADHAKLVQVYRLLGMTE